AHSVSFCAAVRALVVATHKGELAAAQNSRDRPTGYALVRPSLADRRASRRVGRGGAGGDSRHIADRATSSAGQRHFRLVQLDGYCRAGGRWRVVDRVFPVAIATLAALAGSRRTLS